MEGLVIILLIWGGAFALAHKLGKTRNRRGWLYALLGGWLGVIILACTNPKNTPKSELEALREALEIQQLRKQLEENA